MADAQGEHTVASRRQSRGIEARANIYRRRRDAVCLSIASCLCHHDSALCSKRRVLVEDSLRFYWRRGIVKYSIGPAGCFGDDLMALFANAQLLSRLCSIKMGGERLTHRRAIDRHENAEIVNKLNASARLLCCENIS